MNWKAILSIVLGKSPGEVKAKYGGPPRAKAAQQSKRAGARTEPCNARAKRKAQRKVAQQSRRRNRG
jgi:hypothetical protein